MTFVMDSELNTITQFTLYNAAFWFAFVIPSYIFIPWHIERLDV